MLPRLRRAAASVLLLPIVAGFGLDELAAKEWMLQDGRSFRGECTGAVGGQVVIKTAARREYVPLGMFSLADRDEVCAFLVAKNLKQQVVELMAFENRKAAPAARTTSTNPASPDYADLDVTVSPGKPEPGSYDLPVPSRDLVEPAALRDWTDITGDRLSASFEKIVPPAHVRLRGADGTMHRFALVNFVQADFAAMRAILEADADKPVFPDMPPTSTAGRTWRDRRGRSLQAEFARLSGKDVVLKFAAEERNFPIAGLSADDVEWIRSELQRRMTPPPQTPSPSATSPAPRAPRALGHNYEFRCRTCGHTWTDFFSTSSCSQCEERRRKERSEAIASRPPLPPPAMLPPNAPSRLPAESRERLEKLQEEQEEDEFKCFQCKMTFKVKAGTTPSHCRWCQVKFDIIEEIDPDTGERISRSAKTGEIREPLPTWIPVMVIGLTVLGSLTGLGVTGGLILAAVRASKSGGKSGGKKRAPPRRRRDDDEYDDDWD